jgi:hypothetical protein
MSEWRSDASIHHLLEGLKTDGWDLSLPRTVSHDVCTRTRQDAETLASDLRAAGYVVESVFEDDDYDRWELTVKEGEMMLVTTDAVIAAQARLEHLILARDGWLNGVGVQTREEER